MKTWAAAFALIIATLAGLTWYLTSQREKPAMEGDFQVYQSGAALELSIDLASIANVRDGFVRFTNQERYSETKHEDKLDIDYRIRRLEGRADCQKQQYAFVNASYWTAGGKHLYTQMFQLQRFNWEFSAVEPDSVADAMMRIVCRLAPNATSLDIE